MEAAEWRHDQPVWGSMAQTRRGCCPRRVWTPGKSFWWMRRWIEMEVAGGSCGPRGGPSPDGAGGVAVGLGRRSSLSRGCVRAGEGRPDDVVGLEEGAAVAGAVVFGSPWGCPPCAGDATRSAKPGGERSSSLVVAVGGVGSC